MWIMKEPKTTIQPHPPSGGGITSSSALSDFFLDGAPCVILFFFFFRFRARENFDGCTSWVRTQNLMKF